MNPPPPAGIGSGSTVTRDNSSWVGRKALAGLIQPVFQDPYSSLNPRKSRRHLDRHGFPMVQVAKGGDEIFQATRLDPDIILGAMGCRIDRADHRRAAGNPAHSGGSLPNDILLRRPAPASCGKVRIARSSPARVAVRSSTA